MSNSNPQLNVMDASERLMLAKLSEDQHSLPQLVVLSDEFSTSFISHLGQLDANESKPVVILSNRFDAIQAARNAKLVAYLSDFDFSTIKTSYSNIYVRLPKEKPVAHHIIDQALRALSTEAQLCVVGEKNAGIKGYGERIKKQLGLSVKTKKNGITYTVSVNCPAKAKKSLSLLSKQNYYGLQTIYKKDAIKLLSKPGVFGWNKIDKGSELLVENLSDWLNGFQISPKSILDLGCGYGYLSVMAAQHELLGFTSFESISATDSNVLAAQLCEANLIANLAEDSKLAVDVSCDDCGQELQQRYDSIVCNPPFHRGFQHDSSLTHKFLTNTRALLKPKGKALWVVNEFIAIEDPASELFTSVRHVTSNASFKLIELSNG